MKNKKGEISIALICLVLGIMLSVQFKTAGEYESSLRTARVEDLTVKLQILTAERDQLLKETESLKAKLENVRDDNKAMADMQEELKRANMSAGLLPVKGPGLIITLNDSQRPVQPGEDPNALLIHDDDLLRIVNELKASGAEAISINGERLIAMSEIRCAGTTILVNWKKIFAPFVIQATGDPQMLESGLSIKGGYLEALKFSGLQVQMQKSDKIEIPAYSGTFEFTFSSPLEKKEKAE